MNKKLLTIPALMLAATVMTVGITSASAESTPLQLGLTSHGSTSVSSGDGMNATMHSDANVSVRAQDNNSTSGEIEGNAMMDSMHHLAGIFGTVTAINGNTITVTSIGFGKTAPAQTFTIDASAATVDKNKAASTVSGIAVGDTIMVQGTVNGTVVTATKIHDGVMMKGKPSTKPNPATIPEGNGQPIIGGTVTAVNGNTVTITNKSNASYTIDMTNAKITKNDAAGTVSNIAIGDNILAQGTFNGNAVTAVNVVDSASASANADIGAHHGFFGSIGSFFSHLFGFGK